MLRMSATEFQRVMQITIEQQQSARHETRHGWFALVGLRPILHDSAEPPQIDHAEPIARQLEMDESDF
jgi:hypothetical protein